MEILYFLEGLRTPVLDRFFLAVTQLGSELIFLVLAITVYWCVSKSRGLYLLTVGGLGTIFNQFLKMACRVPRPWVKDPNFTIVESARADAGGYSFPSGHTQNAVGTFGCMAAGTKRRWLRLVWVVLAVLVAFSRMYLGVHTPADVGTAALLAAVLVLVFYPVFQKVEQRPKLALWVLGGMIAVNALFVLYANLWQFPAEVDTENLAHGAQNSVKLLGALVGMTVGYWADLKWVRFRPEAHPAGQVLKVVLGLTLLLAIRSGLKPLLGDSLAGNAVRYGIMTLFASCIWPMTFRFFGKIGKKA